MMNESSRIETTALPLHADNQEEIKKTRIGKSYIVLLAINYMCLFLGSVSSSLLSKFYFIHNGSSKWVSTWVQSAGFPLLLFPIYLPYYLQKSSRRPFSRFTSRLLILSIVIGFLLGINNLLFSWSVSYLPVSTSSLLLSSQLAFTLVFSMIIVKQKATFSNLNCVFLLTLSSVLLALGSSNDSNGLSRSKYFIGYFSTIGAGLLFALYLPVMEMIYREVYCYTMVVEMQLIMEIAATVLATIGMALDNGFSERKSFNLGTTSYWLTITFNVITWQLCFMGTAGMVFLTSSLTGGVCMTALMAMNVLGGVIVYKDNFGGSKVVSTLMCIWGFCSYVYGMYCNMKEKERESEKEKIKIDQQHHSSIEMSQVS